MLHSALPRVALRSTTGVLHSALPRVALRSISGCVPSIIMKFKKNIILCLLLILPASCQKDKKQFRTVKERSKKIHEYINDSLNSKAGAGDFTVNVINSKDGLISNNIRQIFFKMDNIILLADRGIIRIHKDTGHIINFTFMDKKVDFQYGKLIDNNIFIIDKSGLYKFSGNSLAPLSRQNDIIPGIIDRDGWVYFFTSIGNIFRVHSSGTNVSLVKSYSDLTFDLVFQHKNNILLSSGNVLYNLNIKNFSLTNIVSVPDENINYALRDKDKLYFGSKALYEFDMKSRITTKITSIN